jgi:hypothetical protein
MRPPSSSLGGEEHREEVVLRGRVAERAAALDEAADDLVEARGDLAHAAVGRRREPVDQRDEEVERVGEALHHGLDALRRPRSVSPASEPNSACDDDVRGGVHHRVVEVDALAVAPRRAEAGGVVDHDPRVARDALAVEGRLDEPTLALPEVALAGEEPLAEDALELAEEDVLLEARGLLHQHLVDERWALTRYACWRMKRIVTTSPRRDVCSRNPS